MLSSSSSSSVSLMRRGRITDMPSNLSLSVWDSVPADLLPEAVSTVITMEMTGMFKLFFLLRSHSLTIYLFF